MFLTYLRRELTNRKKQTVIIAIGMALAIALVIIVSSIASGVKSAQTTVLQSVYGVGTDITVTKTPSASSAAGRPSFSFGADGGSSSSSGSGSKTNLSQSKLTLSRGSEAMASSALTTVSATAGVSKATGVLQLEDDSFSGSVTQNDSGTSGSTSGGASSSGGTSSSGGVPSGDATGRPAFGGGAFSFDQTSVEGIPVSGSVVGPLTSTKSTSGRTFTAADAGKDVAILDKSYAKTDSKQVGDTVTLGGTKFTVVGIVGSTDSSSTTASNVYIPLDTAQKLSGETGKITTIYVSASSSSDVDAIQSALEQKLSGTTVSTEADLASSVSGSLSTASSLVSNLGTWLSIVVLAAAFLIAILFTISGVTRRTREFGTLKAIGWSNGRITRQVAGESLVQGLIGGIIGAAAGLVGIIVVNVISPTISASASTAGAQAGGTGGAGAAGGLPGGAASAAAESGSGTASGTSGFPGSAGGFGGGGRSTSTTDVVLHAPVTVEIILVAIGLAIVGGLIAGALGGWRASRLRPAEALRSVA